MEALRRLDMDRSRPPRILQDLIAVTLDLLGAARVALVIVEADHSWTAAHSGSHGTGDQGDRTSEVPREARLADRLVREDADILVRAPSSDGPHEATLAAHVVRAPGGEAIGAIEAELPGAARELTDAETAGLRRCASLAAELLDLHAEAAEYGRFIELSPDPIAILDADGSIEQVNTSFLSMLGARDATELTGQGFLELVERTDRARVTAQLARVLFMQRRSGRLVLRLVGVDGRSIPCAVSAGHLRGVRRHLQLVVHDLTDQLRVEDEHSRLSEQLARAQRLDAVGQIAGGLAHDLNNLLVVMVSNLGLARESLDQARVSGLAEDLVPAHEDLRELELAVERAGGLTTKLLQFARDEEGTSDRADVAEVIGAVRGLLGRSLGDEITLEIDCPDDLPILAADPVQLERVLLNLILNARDAIDGAGVVRVRVRIHAPGDPARRVGEPVIVGGRDGTAERRRRAAELPRTGRPGVSIDVEDDGRGMDDAVRARAFEPLFTTKAGAGGSGLGLASVLAFIDQWDGDITLDSTPGEGTSVTLVLPTADGEIATVPVGVDVPVAGARIVLVDPRERTRRVIQAMLTGAGYRVTAVSSGEAAIEVLERDGADLLVTELALPGIPGMRLLDLVARQHPQVRPLALAAVDQPRTLDGTPVLVKPFSHTRLLRTVERIARPS